LPFADLSAIGKDQGKIGEGLGKDRKKIVEKLMNDRETIAKMQKDRKKIMNRPRKWPEERRRNIR
jgi:hypothetical protein